MSSELLATYAGLGMHDGEHYYKGEECLGMYDLTFIALETCGCVGSYIISEVYNCFAV